MGKLPAFQFYPGDWRKDMGVQSLSYHDRGVWWEILCLMHESERRGVLILNGAAMSEESLARLLGLDKQNLTTTITTLITSGVASREEDTGAIYSRRMVRDENLRKVRVEAGSKGGNPVLLNQNPTTPVKQIPTPSSSSSSSSSITKPSTSSLSDDLKPSPKERVASKPQDSFSLPEWVPAGPWKDWLEVRKKKRAVNTPHALDLAVRELARLRSIGEDPEAVINQSILRGYTGLFSAHGTGNAKPTPKTIYANGSGK